VPFARQVIDGGLCGAEEKVGNVVGDDAVDLLRHRAVEAAQAGLDVGEGQVQLGRGERAGQRRVGVAEDDHPVGRLLLEHRLQALQHLSGLASVRPGADAEVVVGLRD